MVAELWRVIPQFPALSGGVQDEVLAPGDFEPWVRRVGVF